MRKTFELDRVGAVASTACAIHCAAIPILLVAMVYLPLRWWFARAATAGRRLVDAGGDLDLFALRAMSHQPLHRLTRVSSDPAGAWRRGDSDVVRALAELELRDAGLMPARLPAATRGKA